MPERYPHGSGRPSPAVCGAGFSADGGARSTDAETLAMVEAMHPARQREPLGYTMQVRQAAAAVKDLRASLGPT